MATKTVDLRQLRRELIIREWTRIFKNFRYLGFVGFTKGVPWRRLFLRQRVTEGLSEVDARFCKPWEGREVTENLGWKDMKPLFLGFPSAVCFSNDSQQFMEAMKRSCSLIPGIFLKTSCKRIAVDFPGGLLLGAKVDELLLSGPSFQKILASSNELSFSFECDWFVLIEWSEPEGIATSVIELSQRGCVLSHCTRTSSTRVGQYFFEPSSVVDLCIGQLREEAVLV